MRVIPVLDLVAGRAVRACRGSREAYAPVHSALLSEEQAGDALALARAFRDRLGQGDQGEWYVADLDAITGAAPQRALLRALAAAGGRLLVDAAATTPARAREVLADGARRVVVGLETLPCFQALREIARSVGRERVVFSLDLRDGEPIVLPGAPHRGTPLELARAAVDAGAGAILVLDLARVGTALGVDLALVRALRQAHPEVELLAGGGVRSRQDLEDLADAGCDGALVASALHDAALGKADIELVRRRASSPWQRHSSDSR